MNKLFQLSFVPRSSDCALLLLRLWFGLTLFFNHGLGKLSGFSSIASSGMYDPLHLPGTINAALLVLAEVVCSALVVIGAATRLAALIIVIEMAIAFTMVHHLRLAMGPGSGELAFLNLGAFLAIVFAGPGRVAVDGQ